MKVTYIIHHEYQEENRDKRQEKFHQLLHNILYIMWTLEEDNQIEEGI